MINSDFDSSELTAEKNLFQIYKKARSIPSSWFNKIVLIVVFLFLSIYVLLTTEPTPVIAEKTRVLTNTGFLFTAPILGFLLAGFAVSTNYIDSGLLVMMAQIEQKESKLSYLKYNLFSFMNVFAVYIAFAIFCVMIKLFVAPGGLVTILLSYLDAGTTSIIKRYLACVGIIVSGTWFVHAILLLKSFIFNIYNVIVAVIRWKFENTIKNDNS